MLIQNRENKKYSLGSKLMAMSVKCRTSRSFGRIASKYVDQLGQLTGETVNLSTCSGDRITMCITRKCFVFVPISHSTRPIPL